MAAFTFGPPGTPGTPVMKASIRMPLTGAWHADILVDAQTNLAGPVVFASGDGAVSLTGSVFAGDVWQDVRYVRMVAGAGGLNTALPAKAYLSVSASNVIAEILSAAGERISSKADATLLSTAWKSYTRVAGTCGQALASVVDLLGCSWRFLDDGSIWFGSESYPAAPTSPFVLIARYPEENRRIYSTDSPIIRPGYLFDSKKVSYVEHHIEARSSRSEVWIERS